MRRVQQEGGIQQSLVDINRLICAIFRRLYWCNPPGETTQWAERYGGAKEEESQEMHREICGDGDYVYTLHSDGADA